MSFRESLKSLVSDAHLFQYAEVNSTTSNIEKNKPRYYFTKIQWGILMISVVVSITTVDGFGKDFAGYVVSALSLFAGLFFSFILMLIDKFQKIDFSPYKKDVNAQLMPIGVRLKNYYKKATTLSFYIIVLALLCILLLSASLLSIPFHEICQLVEKIISASYIDVWKTIWEISSFIVKSIYRGVSIYFLLDFLWITLYLLSSFFDYVGSEYDKVKLQ
ncbi:MAG: hypothetical protein HXN40_10545 [Prevotella histicola]|nr:hypothetical protein [Prevotella histicola]MBF1423997.1 hypothetical protein [Prevotella histicola]